MQRVCAPLGPLLGARTQANTAIPSPLARARPQQGGGVGAGAVAGGFGGGGPFGGVLPPVAQPLPSEEAVQSIMVLMRECVCAALCLCFCFRTSGLTERGQCRPCGPLETMWKRQPTCSFLVKHGFVRGKYRARI
jgi:hypothetical protein